MGFLVSGGSYAPNAAGLQRHGAKGSITISNCEVRDTVMQGALVEGKSVDSQLELLFNNVSFVNTSHYDPSIYPRQGPELEVPLPHRGDTIGFGCISTSEKQTR